MPQRELVGDLEQGAFVLPSDLLLEWGLGRAGPVFVPHWADGDLLVGDTLIDVKTVLRADDPAKVGPWLWQVLAYAWLDSRSDHYRTR